MTRREKLPNRRERLLSRANEVTAAAHGPQLDATPYAARVVFGARLGAGQPRIEIQIGAGQRNTGAAEPPAPIAKTLRGARKVRQLR